MQVQAASVAGGANSNAAHTPASEDPAQNTTGPPHGAAKQRAAAPNQTSAPAGAEQHPANAAEQIPSLQPANDSNTADVLGDVGDKKSAVLNATDKKNATQKNATQRPAADISRIVAAPDSKGGGSIFSQLSTKIRQLERNMTLSSRFLEQMRSRYIKLNLSLTQGFNSTNVEFRRMEALMKAQIQDKNATQDQAMLLETVVGFVANVSERMDTITQLLDESGGFIHVPVGGQRSIAVAIPTLLASLACSIAASMVILSLSRCTRRRRHHILPAHESPHELVPSAGSPCRTCESFQAYLAKQYCTPPGASVYDGENADSEENGPWSGSWKNRRRRDSI